MQKDWIVVYRTGELHRAEMAKQMLQQNGIEAVIMNQKDSSYLIGNIEVFVQAENETSRITAIKEFRNLSNFLQRTFTGGLFGVLVYGSLFAGSLLF
jgi:hypothetical protein